MVCITSEGLGAYNLTIQEVLPDHNGVHTCGFFKGQECKASRTPCSITHDRAGVDLSELGEIISERVWNRGVELSRM